MEQKKVSRRNFFTRTAALTGVAAAAYSMEDYNLLAFQQGERQGFGGAPGQGPGGRGQQQPALPDIPGPIPTVKIGGIPVTRLMAGHNLMVGQAHDSGSGLIYISSLLRAYFTEPKVLETFGMYEKHGINTSGARMAANNSDWAKKYMAQGGKLNWMAGISSENDLPMAKDMGCKLAYVHGNTADGLMRTANGTDGIAKLLDAIRKAGMVGGICCHQIDVVTACEKADIKPSFYLKTYNTINFMANSGGERGDPNATAEQKKAEAERITKQIIDVMASVKVPWIGFKIAAAGRTNPSVAFPDAFKVGCDALLVGMYDFQVANNANLTKKILLEKDKIVRTRPWLES
jgi:hypothetical protein